MEPLRQRFLAYLDACGAAPEPSGRSPVVGLMPIFVGIALLLAVSFPYHHRLLAPLLPLGALWLLESGGRLFQRLAYQRRLARARKIVATGFPAAAHVVWSDERLERPGWEPGGCRALLTFETDAARDSHWLRYLAGRCQDLLPRRVRLVPGRRIRLPESRTDGYAVYLVDLEIAPAHLPEGYLTGAPLPCLAEPGESGGVELIPHWLIFPIEGATSAPRRSERV